MTESPGPVITVVIPAYNEEKTIAMVVEGSRKHANEVLVIDDGSIDSTANLAKGAGANVIRIPRNSGKGHALSIGLTAAALNGGDVVVCLDADGQHDPNDIPRIVQPILESRADMVIGSRFLHTEARMMIPAYRRLGLSLLTYVTNLGSDVKITDSQSGYRAFSISLAAAISLREKGMSVESEIVRRATELGYRIHEVPIRARYAGLQTSTLNPLVHGFEVFSYVAKEAIRRNLQLAVAAIGAVLLLLGLALPLAWSGMQDEQYSITGLPTVVCMMIASVGIIMSTFGLMAWSASK